MGAGEMLNYLEKNHRFHEVSSLSKQLIIYFELIIENVANNYFKELQSLLVIFNSLNLCELTPLLHTDFHFSFILIVALEALQFFHVFLAWKAYMLKQY
jgi:hypothetical protein